MYTADGWSSSTWVFGGGPAVARELAGRAWETAPRSGFGVAEPPEQYGPAKLVAGELVHDAGILRRAQGCLLGQLAGDALGSLVEFQDRDSIEEEYPNGPRELLDGGTWNTLAGQPTDDSELALLLGRTLVSQSGFDAEAVATAYARWFHGWTHDARAEPCGHAGCRPFDIGGTTRRALRAVRSADVVSGRASATATAAADPGSQANGALMRVSPLGIWGWQLPLQQLADAARADARLTHPNMFWPTDVLVLAERLLIARGSNGKSRADERRRADFKRLPLLGSRGTSDAGGHVNIKSCTTQSRLDHAHARHRARKRSAHQSVQPRLSLASSRPRWESGDAPAPPLCRPCPAGLEPRSVCRRCSREEGRQPRRGQGKACTLIACLLHTVILNLTKH